ncbi:hypothetical protein H6F89_28975 [Cyanobacteria bacterium FACHB-63]|nr:hypothetical protein [Cyanobacteria bacterium FACHB-63]
MSLSTQPDQPTPDQIRGILQNTLDNLHSQAFSNKAAFNTSKTAGLGSAVLGVVACFGVPALGIPAAMFGAATYFAGLIGESATTDQVRVLPFCNIDLTGFARMLTQTGAADSTDLEFAAYLPKRDRLLYLLILTQGEGLVHLLSKVPSRQWEPTIEALLNQTIRGLRKVGGEISYQMLINDGGSILETESRELGFDVPTTDRAIPQAVAQPQIIGTNTRLGAVDVPSAPTTETSVVKPQQMTKEQVIALPLPERARYLMELLALYGCDLRKLAGRSTLAAGGLQRSGKTTLIILLAILEKALGQKIYYISRDNDLYPVAFDGYANGSTANAVEALTTLSDRISGGSVGSLAGETWVLDEFSSIAKELPDKAKDQFWGMTLTGFAKQDGRVRFLVHHKTASANGIPKGESETFKAEVKMFWTDRAELSDGTYQPSGTYELLAEVAGHYKETGEKFTIPSWLLTDVNPSWNNAPCPVRSLLSFFPEFDTRKGAKAEPLSKASANPFGESSRPPIASTPDQLQKMFEMSSPLDHEVDEEIVESTSSLDEIRSAFPMWNEKTLTLAAFIVDWLRGRASESFTAPKIRNVKRLRDDPKLTNENLTRLLTLLSDKGFVAEDNGKFSALVEDYDF